jgi:hypothetical protein
MREYFKYFKMKVRQLREWAKIGSYMLKIFTPDFSAHGENTMIVDY